jgi:hypothetical protein
LVKPSFHFPFKSIGRSGVIEISLPFDGVIESTKTYEKLDDMTA